ncbi:MAG: hypothetical protein PHD49_00165 [Candidatus Shapirobacteria bacterium]|nr:hypothetical protein [Candidatus Shapirobacteria bacterium]
MPTKEPREIVNSALTYLQEVTPSIQRISDVRLEELAPIEDGVNWRVVLSYDAVGEFPFDKKREYKEFIVESNTGKVLSMTIKKV